MMKKLRGFFGILLCVLLTASLLAGCNTGGGAAQTSAATTAAANTTTAAPAKTTASAAQTTAAPATDGAPRLTYEGASPVFDKPFTISWLCTNGSTLVYDFENMAWCQKILENANVVLEMELLDSAVYNDSVMPRLAAGVDLPDVIQIPNKDTDMTFINSGIFVELTGMYDKYAYNLNERFADNPTVKAQSTTPDGKIFYIPGINMSIDYCTAISLNVEWMTELGLSNPTTTEEYYEVLSAFKGHDFNGNGQNDEIPLFLRAGMLQLYGAMWGLELFTNGYMPGENGVVECSYTSDRYLDFLNYFHRMYEEGLLYNEFATSTYDIQNNLISNKQVGSLLHYHNNNLSYSQLINPSFDIANDKLIISPIEPLAGPYGHQFYWGNDPVFGFWGISRNCDNPEAVFCFLDYLYSKEANDLLYFGLEDVDYTVKNDQMVLDLAKRQADNYANRMGNNFGGFPRILLAVHRDLAYTPEIAANNQRLRDSYKLPIGSMFCLPDEVEVMQTYATDLKTYWDEMFLKFVTGTENLAGFDNYVSTLKAMGVDDMVAVYQAIYDRLPASGN